MCDYSLMAVPNRWLARGRNWWLTVSNRLARVGFTQ